MTVDSHRKQIDLFPEKERRMLISSAIEVLVPIWRYGQKSVTGVNSAGLVYIAVWSWPSTGYPSTPYDGWGFASTSMTRRATCCTPSL